MAIVGNVPAPKVRAAAFVGRVDRRSLVSGVFGIVVIGSVFALAGNPAGGSRGPHTLAFSTGVVGHKSFASDGIISDAVQQQQKSQGLRGTLPRTGNVEAETGQQSSWVVAPMAAVALWLAGRHLGGMQSERRNSKIAKVTRLSFGAKFNSVAKLPLEEEERKATAMRALTTTADVGDVGLVTSVDPSAGKQGTYQVGIDFKGWLQSCTEELQVGNLRVTGELPAWMSGSLVHAGPAKFEFGDDEFVDWVDGQAMLYRLRIDKEGKCEYTNKWLDTANHRAHRAAGRIAIRETCSRPSLGNFFERFMYLFQPPNNENGNLHISRMGERCVSMSVGSSIVEFNLNDLTTYGKLKYQDDIDEQGPLIFHSEPHVDYETGEWFSTAIQLKISPEHFGLKPEYVVFSIKPEEQSKEPGAPIKRNLITRIQTEYPAPMHTIGVTKKYLVLVQMPYPLNWDGMLSAEAKWLMSGKYEGNLNDYNTWQPERQTVITLVDKVTGEHVQTFETDPFFYFHIVNSFEEIGGSHDEKELVLLDLIAYQEPPVGFPLRQARAGDVEEWRGGGGEVMRYEMNVETGEITSSGWPDNCFDEPKVNCKVAGEKYTYSFGVVDFNGTLRLKKLNHDTHEEWFWEEQDVSRDLPWQPVFAPEPYADNEDAGMLLSFVRDQPTGNTYMVCIDGETMKEKARVHFPEGHHLPLHGHGTWMQGAGLNA